MPLAHKLNYEIVGCRPLTIKRVPGMAGGRMTSPGAIAQPDLEMNAWDVKWTHVNGLPPSMKDNPVRLSVVDTILENSLSDAVKKNIITQEHMNRILEESRTVFVPMKDQSDTGIYKTVDVQRPYIGDQVNVPVAIPKAAVEQLLEAKREFLAKALGVEP